MNKVLDGRTRFVNWDDLESGKVLRMVQPSDPQAIPSFSDFVVVSKSSQRDSHDFDVTLARPYATISGAGTTSPSVLTGVETLVVPASRLVGPESLFRAVLLSTGANASHTT